MGISDLPFSFECPKQGFSLLWNTAHVCQANHLFKTCLKSNSHEYFWLCALSCGKGSQDPINIDHYA